MLKRLVVLIIFQNENLKDCVMKLLKLLLQIISLAPKLSHIGKKAREKFNGSCLKQDKIRHTRGTIVNIYIIFELSSNLNYDENVTFENCLFYAVKLTQNDDISKYKYSGYCISLDEHETFLFFNGGSGQNVIIFSADMSFSVHVDNEKKYIFILGEAPQMVQNLLQKKGIQLILPSQKRNFV